MRSIDGDGGTQSNSIQMKNHTTGDTFTFEDAARIEQEAHAQDERRRQEAEERKRRRGLPIKGEVLTEKERAARIWAFMYAASLPSSATCH